MVVIVHEDMEGVENEPVHPKITDAKGVLKQNREFLDFFWDIAKPERDIRLKAIEGLIEYLKKTDKADELQYTLKRLVDGLSHTREDARTGYSLALAQLLSVFEDIQLQTILDQIKQKNSLEGLQKKQIRNVAFGNFFGVLAISQSTRLSKEPQILLQCVRLLQRISQFSEHLRDLPRKTMVDLLSETSPEVFEETLLGALQSDLTSALSTPEHLELLLVAMQKFPDVLKPKKVKKLLGSAAVVTKENVPQLVDVLRTAARSVKKESFLPPVAMDLLELSLREDTFDLFWNDVIVGGLMNDQPGPSHYMCFRLMGSALPHLSVPQIQQVLSSDVMRLYGEHVMLARQPERFKIAPEIEAYVKQFVQGCTDADKQLAVMVGFTQITNQGSPVMPSAWKVVEGLVPLAVEGYVSWLKGMFLKPQLDDCLDFTTRRQKEIQKIEGKSLESVLRLRKWILPRLTSIVVNQQVKKDEDLVMDIARFIFFHAFFTAKKSTPDIPETENKPSGVLDEKTRAVLVSSFFVLLQHLNHLPVQGEAGGEEAAPKKHLSGVTADGSSWLYCLVQYADVLLTQTKFVQKAKAFSEEQKSSWASMMKSVEALQKKAKKAATPETSAFQLLFLLVGIQLFKSQEESVDLIQDIQSCMEKVNAKKTKKKKKADAEEEEEPHWVEVLVEVLLSLLSQPSRLIRNVCKTVFGRICSHVNQGAITAILDVLDPSKEDSALEVTDDKDSGKSRKRKNESDDEEEEEEEEDEGETSTKKQKVAEEEGAEEESESSDDDDDDEEDLKDDEEVDPNFRLDLMKVLQGQGALATEGDQSEDEDLDDAAMMKLDGSIATLFAEQKKRMQAKKDERDKLRKEKVLIREFKIKVLDLVEVYLDKQSANPLVLGMIEPLLAVIEGSMGSDRELQEIDFLRRAADIFRNTLCRGKQYCKNVSDRTAELHDLLERLITRSQKLSDSSVALYYFSAALYVVKVLRGVPTQDLKQEGDDSQVKTMGNLDVERVTPLFKEALVSFMTHRKSPLTGAMFLDLFNRLPVFSSNLLDTLVEYITTGVREHQQGQACAIMLKGLQSKEIQTLLAGARWKELCQRTVDKLTETFGQGLEVKNKIVQEKIIKALELCLYLVKNIRHQKIEVDLEPIKTALQSMSEKHDFHKSGHMEDMYWSVVKHFGIQKPKVEKAPKAKVEVVEAEAEGEPNAEQTPETEGGKKKKGFLPESKKRKNRKKPPVVEGKDAVTSQPTKKPSAGPVAEAGGEGGEPGKKKKKNRKKKNKKRKHPEGGEGAPAGQSPAKKPKVDNQPAAKKPKNVNQPPAKKDKTKPKGDKKKKGKKGAAE
ncbi:myb-binding protein 1A-like protein [Engraulis encrasicolus]|uniref:myb-binding protein 1A-like protein n=1 Tax=Engraulis encrasicolus TaxID=184585 RepID=UPI002FD1B1A0